MKYLLLLLCLVTVETVQAQDTIPPANLLKPTIADLRKIPHRAAAAPLPPNFTLPDTIDLEQMLPPCGDQGKQGACAAFSAVYDYLSFLEFQKYRKNYVNNGQTDSTTLFSPKFTFSLVLNDMDPSEQDCLAGGRFEDFILKVQYQGAPTIKDLPYNKDNTTDCMAMPEPEIFQKAMKNRFVAIDPLFAANIQESQVKLAQQKPIMFEMAVDSAFYKDGKAAFAAGKKFVYQYNPARYYGFHALVCVGYDNRTKLVKIMNSYGTNWGTRGYFYMNYQDYINSSPQRYIAYANTTTAVPTDSLDNQNNRVYAFNPKGVFKDWFRLGFYKVVDKYEIGINYVNKIKKEVIVSIRNKDLPNKYNNMILFKNETKYFVSGDKRINVTFEGIDVGGAFSYVNDVQLTIKISDTQNDPVISQLLKNVK